MTEHLTSENIERYRRRDFDPARQREADTHLANCQACVERLLDSEHSVLAFNSINEALLPSQHETAFHLSKTELTAYLTGNIDEVDRIIYSSHLEDCGQCQSESHAVSAAAALHSTQPSPAVEPARKGRPWAGWSWLTPARVAVALVIIGLLAFALFQWRRQSSTDLRSDLQINPSNSPASGSPGSAPTPQPGATVLTPAALVVLKDNNREIRLQHDGKFTGLEGLDDATQQAIITALKGELPKPKVIDDLSSPRIKLSGTPGSESFQLVSPLAKVITDDRPTLRWRPLQAADSYIVSIFDENFNRVARSPSLTTTNWTSSVSLKRGQRYAWEVTATRDGKEIVSPVAPASAATFRILDAEQTSALARLKRETPVSHLALAIAYARAGLVNDALREFRQIVKENPDSEIAKRLLRTVQGWK